MNDSSLLLVLVPLFFPMADSRQVHECSPAGVPSRTSRLLQRFISNFKAHLLKCDFVFLLDLRLADSGFSAQLKMSSVNLFF